MSLVGMQRDLQKDRRQLVRESSIKDLAKRITLLPVWTNKIFLRTNQKYQENNKQQYDRKVYTEQVDNILPPESFAIQSNPGDFISDRYGSGDIIIMSEERLVAPSTMKIGPLFSQLAANHTDQNRMNPKSELEGNLKEQKLSEQMNRICYRSAQQQNIAMRSLRRDQFYWQPRELINKQNLLTSYDALHKVQIQNQFSSKQKKVIKLKGRNQTSNQLQKQNVSPVKEQKYSTKPFNTKLQYKRPNHNRSVMAESSGNRYLHITLTNSPFARRLNTSILRTPAKKHHKSTERVVTIFMTEGDRNPEPSTASKRKHGIRVLSKSKERGSSVESNAKGDLRQPNAIQKLFEKDDELSNERKLTCCPSSGDLKSISASEYHFENRASRNKKIKPINQLVCKYPKPIRLFNKRQSNTHTFRIN